MTEKQQPSRCLDSEMAVALIGFEAPGDLFAQGQNIVKIGNLSEVANLRRVDVSFNPLETLNGIEKLIHLRSLDAYSCKLSNIDSVVMMNKLEMLMLQQNQIESIPSALRSLIKLRELRLDRNYLKDLANINTLQNLRFLDVSGNNISSLEGLSGLQQLQELRVSHNSITSLKPLKHLPQLKELNVSYNLLSSLDGLLQLQNIETVYAEHNRLSAILLESVTADSGSRSDGQSQPSSARSVQSSSVPSTHRSQAVSSQGNPQKSPSTTSTTSTKRALGSNNGSSLNDLLLTGNRLRSSALKGLRMFSKSLELLDLRNNSIEEEEDLLIHLGQLPMLAEVRIAGNPLLVESVGRELLIDRIGEGLRSRCPNIRMLDDQVIAKVKNAFLNNADEVEGETGAVEGDETFHTWEKISPGDKDGSDAIPDDQPLAPSVTKLLL